MFRIQNAIAALTLAFVIAAPARADLFLWESTCLSANWWSCCEDEVGKYNNWWSAPYEDCPSFPSTVDDVEIGSAAVDLTSSAWCWSLHTGGVFRLFDGGLDVQTVATFDYHLEWNAGSLVRGTFNLLNSAELRTTAGKFLAAAILNINGGAVATITGVFNLSMQDHARIDIKPLGLFDLQTDANIYTTWGAAVAADGVHVSPGATFRKRISAGLSEINVPFNNDGTTEIKAGTIRLDNWDGASTGAFALDAGTVLEIVAYNWNPGTTVNGDGLVRLAAPGFLDVNAGADVTVPNFQMNSGFSQRRGDGRMRISNAFNWSGGGLSAPGYGITDIQAGATLALSGDDSKFLLSHTFNNAGAATFSGNGSFNILGGDAPATFNNLAGATFDIQTDADIVPFCCGAAGQFFNNAGLFKKSTGTETTDVTLFFTNTGSVEARSGTLNFGEYHQTAGQTRLLGGNLACYAPMIFDGGVLEGSGTITAHVANNAATIKPGLSPGTITIPLFTYTQAPGGTLSIELGGLTPGTEHDQLRVPDWSATLAGTLRVSLTNDFVPAISDEFIVVSAYYVLGAFDTLVLDGFPAGLAAEVVYGPTTATLRIIPGLCGTCPGNINADTRLDGADVQAFVACAVSSSVTGGCACADMDSNHAFDSADWSLFVAKLLGDPDATCP